MVNINRTDLEIRWKDGRVSKQLTPFKLETADWNDAGNVYELFGAYFEGEHSEKAFYTPDDLEYFAELGEASVL